MRWSTNPFAADAIDALSDPCVAMTDAVGWRTSVRTAGRLGFGRCEWRGQESRGLAVAGLDQVAARYEVPIRPTILGPGMFP